MSATRKETLSQVMTKAWGLFKANGGTFASALKFAWKIIKAGADTFMANSWVFVQKDAAETHALRLAGTPPTGHRGGWRICGATHTGSIGYGWGA